MPEPFIAPGTTPRFSLPLLFAGQAQKEFFLNEALTVLDGVVSGTVLASMVSPPESPAEGSRYRVLEGADGAWAGRADHIAAMIGGGWRFVAPFAGMQVFDQAEGHSLVFRNGWTFAEIAALPEGGTVIDAEARLVLSELVQALRSTGVLAS